MPRFNFRLPPEVYQYTGAEPDAKELVDVDRLTIAGISGYRTQLPGNTSRPRFLWPNPLLLLDEATSKVWEEHGADLVQYWSLGVSWVDKKWSLNASLGSTVEDPPGEAEPFMWGTHGQVLAYRFEQPVPFEQIAFESAAKAALKNR